MRHFVPISLKTSKRILLINMKESLTDGNIQKKKNKTGTESEPCDLPEMLSMVAAAGVIFSETNREPPAVTNWLIWRSDLQFACLNHN